MGRGGVGGVFFQSQGVYLDYGNYETVEQSPRPRGGDAAGPGSLLPPTVTLVMSRNSVFRRRRVLSEYFNVRCGCCTRTVRGRAWRTVSTLSLLLQGRKRLRRIGSSTLDPQSTISTDSRRTSLLRMRTRGCATPPSTPPVVVVDAGWASFRGRAPASAAAGCRTARGDD